MRDTAKNYLRVTKPMIVLGNLVSAAAGFFLASGGQVNPALLVPAITGISLVVASGCVYNNCIDRGMDRKMVRTKNRVLAREGMPVKNAALFASLLGAAGIALLWAETNLLAVALVGAGFGVYVVLYSLLLKRRSVYGALAGSLAGAVPPLAGYCAVTGRLDMGGLILFLMFSLWQMPHCYAISIYRLDDYAAAGIPVWPVARGTIATRRHIIGYILAFTLTVPLLTAAGRTGCITLAVALPLGLCWLYMAWRGFNPTDPRPWAKKLYRFSILAITTLSIMISIDVP